MKSCCVETPRRLGIAAMSFLPGEGHKARMAREELFRSRDALFAHLHEKVEETARERAVPRDADAEAMFRLGLQAAPLFIGFALFIAERAIMDRLDRLLFLTREGEFFFRLFQTLFPEDRHVGHPLPPSAILAASRYATFIASIEAVSVEEFNRIWNLNWQQKLSTLFEILRIKPQAFSRQLAHLGLSPEELIVRPQEDRRIKELLANKDFIEAVRSSAQEERSQLIAYLQQQGVEPGERIGFVDIGWRGTIQDNLARIVPECETTGYYLALRIFLNPQPQNAIKYSFGLDERLQDTGRFFESFEPLELLCNSPNGSVCSYRRDETGQIVPVREVDKDENAMFERFTQHFQDGVTLAAETWRPLLANHAVMADEMRDMALRVWDGLAAQPPEALIQAYYGAPQHDTFGFGGFFDRKKVPTLATLFLALINRQRRGVVTQYIRRTQWMPALAGLKISPLHRFALTTVFWLALKYKRFFILRRNKSSR